MQPSTPPHPAPLSERLLGRLLAPGGPRLAGALAGAVVVALCAAAWGTGVAWRVGEARHHREALAQHSAQRLQDWLGSRLLVLDTLQAMAARGLLDTPSRWRQQVELAMHTADGLQAINWIDAEGYIRVTAPATGNEQAQGRHLSAHPVAGEVFADAQRSGAPRASPPLDLFQGGRGFTTYLPVRDADGVVTGYVNGVFRVDRMVVLALSHVDLEQDDVALLDGEDLVWSSTGQALPRPDRARGAVQLAGRTWTLQVETARPVVPLAWHLGALGVTVLLAGATAVGAAATTRSASQVAQARREAARLGAMVEEGRRLEALGRVAGGIAHDFNNILAVVVGRASVLDAMLTEAAPPVRQGLSAILDAGERGRQLVEMLLTFARRGEDATGAVDAAAHLRGLEPLLRHLVGRSATFTLRVEVDAAPLGLSPTALDRIAVNLVTNARQACRAEGCNITVALRAAAPEWCLEVADDGVGMDADTRARIFEPFFTTREGGTGLGLSTVFGLVRQAGGRVEVQTAPGRGTRLSLYLPVERADAAPRPPAVSAG